jgi:hypothetical protein
MNLKNLIRTGLCVLVLSFSSTVLPAAEIGAAKDATAQSEQCCEGCVWVSATWVGDCLCIHWICDGVDEYQFYGDCSMATFAPGGR